MFRVEDRERIRRELAQRARSDPRVTASAWVGSSATGGDRWSDIDLALAVDDAVPVEAVLAEWTAEFRRLYEGHRLFDVRSAASLYRVFLFPGSLQVDLSVTPTSAFAPRGPRFALIHGSANPPDPPGPPTPRESLGRAVHHLLRARVAIERGRPWQAEYWVSAARDELLSIECDRLGLPSASGRGLDDLPEPVRATFVLLRATSLERPELLRAIRAALAWVQRASVPVDPSDPVPTPQLVAIGSEDWA